MRNFAVVYFCEHLPDVEAILMNAACKIAWRSFPQNAFTLIQLLQTQLGHYYNFYFSSAYVNTATAVRRMTITESG